MNKAQINRQLVYLFLSSFGVLFVGMGLFPVLPVYASEFGISTTMVGVFFAIMYIANAAGPVFVEALAERVGRKPLFVVSGLIGIPALFLIGYANTFWQVVILTSIVWFSGGVILALVSIFTGLYAEGSQRGKAFSLNQVATPLGSLIGGIVISTLLEWQGYRGMFIVVSLVWSMLPVIGLFGLKDVNQRPPQKVVNPDDAVKPAGFDLRYQLLLGAVLLSATGVAVTRLGTPMAMKLQEIPTATVANTAAVSGLVAIPVIYLFGLLSDRLGRSRFLAVGFLLAGGGSLLLSVADQVWQFYLIVSMMLVAFSATRAMSAALATDFLAPEMLNKGLSRLNMLSSGASILSFAVTGYLLGLVGVNTLFMLMMVFPVLAIGLLELVQHTAPGTTVILHGLKPSHKHKKTNFEQVGC